MEASTVGVGGLWSVWHRRFVSRPKDRDEVGSLSAAQDYHVRTMFEMAPSHGNVNVGHFWNISKQRSSMFQSLRHLMTNMWISMDFWHFLTSEWSVEVKKITDAFHDLVDGKRILREANHGALYKCLCCTIRLESSGYRLLVSWLNMPCRRWSFCGASGMTMSGSSGCDFALRLPHWAWYILID